MIYLFIFTESLQACGAPPKIPHAVIINQEYQDVFAADSEVKYECENGFTVEGADTTKTIICIAGSWTTGPSCSKWTILRYAVMEIRCIVVITTILTN